MTTYMTKTLAAALAATKPAVTRGPILATSHVLIDARAGSVCVDSIDRRIVTPCRPVSDSDAIGPVLVPHAVLSDVLRGCGNVVGFRICDGHRLHVASDRYRATIVGLDPSDAPSPAPVEGGQTMTITPAHVAPLLSAVSQDDGRPNLQRVHIRDGRTWAKDGHRLHCVIAAELVGDVGIPYAAAQDIARAGEPCEVTITDRVVAVRLPDGTECQSRQIEGVFPNVAAVLPRANPERRIHVDAPALRRALAQVARTSNEKSSVKIAASGSSLTLTSADPDRGESTLDVDVTYDGPDVWAAVNWRYIDDALAGCGESAGIEIVDTLQPIQIHSGDVLCVVMPLRG
jgi:DNA polymerase III sliding clamp (beta) subunit (PCNA family)